MNRAAEAPTEFGESIDPRPARRPRARWVLTAELTLHTAAHFGGGDDDSTDLGLVRDRASGAPMLFGTSLAGALRRHLADRLGGYGREEAAEVSDLFGGRRGDDAGSQSPLLVCDALAAGGSLSEIRDGVAIEPRSGTAADEAKFDFEVLPAETTLPLRFELEVGERVDESRLMGLLTAALEGLRPGEVSLGARASRGFGQVRASAWRARRYDLTDRAGWLAYLTVDPEAAPDTQTHDEVSDAVRAWLPAPPTPVDDARSRVIADVKLAFSAGLLVRSPPGDVHEPDAVHLRSGNRPVLPGTSLAGALRAHARRVAHAVHGPSNDAEVWVERLFGPSPGAQDLRTSRLRIIEAPITGGHPRTRSRVRIDRFTQGTVPGALFDEQAHFGGAVTLRMELRDPQPGEVGFLALLLRDLTDGHVPLGGGTAVGHGAVRGSATLHREQVLGEGSQREWLDEELRSFQQTPTAASQETADHG